MAPKHVNPFDGLGPGYRHQLPSSFYDPDYRHLVSLLAPNESWRRWRIEHRAERAKERKEFARHARAFRNAGGCTMYDVSYGSQVYYASVKLFAKERFGSNY